MIDTSTLIGLHGETVEQHMGSTDGYAEYLAGYEAATDKLAYNAGVARGEIACGGCGAKYKHPAPTICNICKSPL